MEPGKTLSERVVKGGFWVFSLRITQQVFSLIRLIILARILSPNDFGLMGIALLVMATLDTFSQTGFQQALIQKKKDIKSYLDSAWTVLILRGFVLFTILYFIAPYAAIFFKAPEAKPIIQVIGFSVLLQAFTNIGVIYFQKELEFNKQFIYQLAGTLADFIVAVSAVLILRSQIIEHLEPPKRAIDESYRVLKKDGIAIHTTCFINYIHPCPKDFWRFSPETLRYLCKDFSEILYCGSWGNCIAILSLPDVNGFYRLNVRIPKIGEIKWLIPLSRLRKPAHNFDGEHYWEIGKAGYPLSKIISDIKNTGFKIEKTYRVFEHPYHRFFTLRKANIKVE